MLATRPRLAEGDPGLAPDPVLGRARDALAAYAPADAAQGRLRDEILDFVDRHPRHAHCRSCRPGHLTASAVVVDEGFERIVLLHHRKLGRWLQPGGHCDGDANLAGVAWREAREETGLVGLEIVPRVIDLDIHDIPARPSEPAHRHLDARFLALAPALAEPRINHESQDVRWFRLDEAREISCDASLSRLLRVLEAARVARLAASSGGRPRPRAGGAGDGSRSRRRYGAWREPRA